jgi:hypothetical protein
MTEHVPRQGVALLPSSVARHRQGTMKRLRELEPGLKLCEIL